MRGEAVDDRAHAVLAHAEVDVLARGVLGEVAGVRQHGVGRGRQVGGPADERRDERRERRHRPLARDARGLLLGRNGLQRVLQARQRLARPGGVPLLGAGGVLAEPRVALGPRLTLGRTPVAGAELLVDPVRHQELRVRIPVELLLGQPDLLLAERRAVGLARTLLVRRRPADDRLDVDQRRAVLVGLGRVERGPQLVEVVDVGDPQRLPAVGLVPPLDVLAERERRRPVERDVVVVVEDDQPAEPDVAGVRRRLRRHPLHQVAVRRDHVGPVILDVGAELLAQEPLGHRQTDRVGDPLTERAGGDLDARGQRQRRRRRADVARDVELALGVPGGLRAPLAERLDVVQAELVAGQVQRRVLQDRAVPGRQHEAIAVRPQRVGRVVLHPLGVEQIGHRRERQRQTRVSRVRLLDRVDRQRPDRVDAERGGGGVVAHSPSIPI